MPELNLDSSIVDERYVVERCLSHGSYAEIFLARDLEHNEETVIIKALNAFLQGTPDEDLERTLVENFQNEAVALDKVRHPNIIRRLGHGTASDLKETPFHYLVLEYLAGGDMSSFCRSSVLDLDHAIFYFGQVCAALAYAHSQQVIHRDIKPQNLLLSEDHQLIKVADFGVAKISPDDTSEVTRVGTNVYAPPEHHPEYQSNELPEPLTPSADIYSLAKTIYTAMSGRAPSRYAHRPIADLPEPLGTKPWADRLLSVLQKATAERVADRYQSVEAFWSDFAALRAWAVATTSGLVHPEADPEATVVRR
ncbi:MAG: serine/threonine protein kinase, partial [Blastocatellia bacterium]